MSKKEVILCGAGGHALVLFDLIRELKLPFKGIVVDKVDERTHPELKGHIFSLEKDFPASAFQDYVFVNGVGSVGRNFQVRKNLYIKMKEQGAEFLSLIHPQAKVSELATVEVGSVVMRGAIIQAGAHISENCIINTGAIIDHDCKISSHCHIATGAVLSGSVSLGEGSHIGAGTVIKNNITIGKHSIVGSGSNVVNDLTGDSVYIGNPSRKIKDL